MQSFISFPTIESGLYMFGGHKHTVNGGWTFFEQSHQVIELMIVTKGHQLTEIKDSRVIDLGPGDAILIAPGTLHTNRNADDYKKMTYMCLHFDFEDVELRSKIIGLLANKLIPAHSDLAHISGKILNDIVNLCKDKARRNDFEVQVDIEIILLQYLKQLSILVQKIKGYNLPFTDKEAKVGRDISVTIEDWVNNDDVNSAFTFSDICSSLHISSGYGHRVFKKVYGITPLRFIDKEKYRKAQRLLEYSGNSIEEIAYMTGAANISIFSKQFKKWSGYSPSEYRKQVLHKRTVYSKNQTGYFE
ncbi:AraC family transcriptional regulator [Limosilactobacillus albertensis]|uniref:AraC family transcriptional regulator n=1 Tax=Limosilactobacillus albertensis TaxID=2759752 RepID=UPI001E3AB7C4|nr:AraC family transcriptional regulator [Limosilactobacillus albertensis]